MTVEEATRERRPVRWLPGVILLVLAPVCIVATWFITSAIADGDRTIMMTATLIALGLAVLIQAIWWLGLARLTWRGRLVGILLVALGAGMAAAAVRIDGYRGEMMPIFAFRWEPTPEERAIAFFEKSGSESDVSDDAAGLGPVTVSEGDWPQYRGSNRDGVAADAFIRTNWNEKPPEVVWKHPVGLGWSGFAVVGDRLFTQEQRGENEVVVSYRASTGEQLWLHSDVARFSETLGGDGPRGTPTVVEGRVYSLGATGLLNCLDAASGSTVWQRDILADAGDGERVENIEWGMAGSPFVWNGKVYVVPGGQKGRGVIAYDAASGEIVWAAGSERASYAAPRVETIAGVPQLLVFHAEGLVAMDPESGDEVWSFGPWTNQPKVNAAQPIVHNDRVFISSGYTIGSLLLGVERQEDDSWNVEPVWRKDNRFKLKFNDALLHDGFLYGLDEGILACIKFDTGEQQWKRGRYGYGQVILVGETLVVLAEDGTLSAVEATPSQFKEIARVPVLEGKTWNHPAFSRGFLYVRNDREAACLDVRP